MEAKTLISRWLEERGLSFNEEKTKINEITNGFNFLGFNCKQSKGKYLNYGSREHIRRMNITDKEGKKTSPKTILRGTDYYKAIITPQEEKVKQLLADIKLWLKTHGKVLTFDVIIKHLNSKIRGWGNYYKYVCSKETFNDIHSSVRYLIVRFLKNRHPTKSWKSIRKTYCTYKDGNNYTFFSKSHDRRKESTKIHLINIAKDIPIVRFIKVKECNSPLNPELKKYWENRAKNNAKNRFAKGSKYQKVLDGQKGICPICGNPIREDESWDVHHKTPLKDGGSNEVSNLMLLHKDCHKAKHMELHY